MNETLYTILPVYTPTFDGIPTFNSLEQAEAEIVKDFENPYSAGVSGYMVAQLISAKQIDKELSDKDLSEVAAAQEVSPTEEVQGLND